MSLYSNRRKLDWKKVNNLRTGFGLCVATVFGAGLFPLAPGTMGTLFGLPVAYWTQSWDWPVRVLFWLLITCLGTWSAGVLDQSMQTDDNQNIVIDEFLGIGIAAWTAGQDLKTWLVAFVLFRFFDAVKPPPIRQIDGWSKKSSSSIGRAFGVMADDIAAACVTLIIILILQKLSILA